MGNWCDGVTQTSGADRASRRRPGRRVDGRPAAPRAVVCSTSRVGSIAAPRSRPVARIEQYPRDQRDRLLGAATISTSSGAASTPRRADEVLADRLAQRRQALARPDSPAGYTGGMRELACPGGGQRRIGQRHAVLEGSARRGCLAGNIGVVVARAGAAREVRLRGRPGVRSARARAVGRLRRQADIAARADAAVDETLRAQLLVGGQHGVARQAQFACQQPRRRQARALAARPANTAAFTARVNWACRGPVRRFAGAWRPPELALFGATNWTLPVPLAGDQMGPIPRPPLPRLEPRDESGPRRAGRFQPLSPWCWLLLAGITVGGLDRRSPGASGRFAAARWPAPAVVAAWLWGGDAAFAGGSTTAALGTALYCYLTTAMVAGYHLLGAT